MEIEFDDMYWAVLKPYQENIKTNIDISDNEEEIQEKLIMIANYLIKNGKETVGDYILIHLDDVVYDINAKARRELEKGKE